MIRWLKDKWQRDLVTLRDRRKKKGRKRKILCPRCGYDVETLPDQPCPECGLIVKSAWRTGRLGAGTDNRDMLASIGMIACGNIAFCMYFIIGFILLHSLWNPNPLPLVTRKDLGWIVGVGLIASVNALVSAYGWKRRRYFLYGPQRPSVIYAVVSLAVVLTTFSIWFAAGRISQP